MGKVKGKCMFNQKWQNTSDLSWVKPVQNDLYSAHCIICAVTFSISNMGKTALTSHMNGKRHRDMVDHLKHSAGMHTYLSSMQNKNSNISDAPPVAQIDIASKENETIEKIPKLDANGNAVILACNNNCSVHCNNPVFYKDASNIIKSTNLKGYLSNDEVTRAEINFCLQAIVRHYSLRDIEDNVATSKFSFPDSEIAKNIKLSKSKASYTIVYGLPKIFEKEIKQFLADCNEIVMGFDESLNKISQLKQMDITIKFWNASKDEVCTRYFTSAFLGKASALDLLDAFQKNIPQDILKKVSQVSMDGPNVNFKFMKDFQNYLNENLTDKILLDLGSCGLHTLHNAFKAGILVTDWKLIPFLRALYNLFKNVPSRRADYTAASGSTKFPKKFGATRWLENMPVVERSRAILQNVKIYVDKATKNKEIPNCNSFKIVSDTLKDPLLDVKLAFFQSLTAEVEPFLREFQTNRPYAPFLYESLLSVMFNVMQKFVKPGVLNKQSVVKTDLQNNDNLLFAKNIKIGYATQDALRKIKDVKSLDILQFREQCRQCLKTFVIKLIEKSPLKLSLVKGISCLDPAIALQSNLATSRLSTALEKFVQAKQLTGIQADKIELEYKQICSMESTMEEFKLFDRSQVRLDTFWMNILNSRGASNYSNLLIFVRKVLILSHGNSDLERGFSINRECLIENQHEKSLIAQRIIFDGVMSRGGLKNTEITKDMIHSARNAHSWYKEALAQLKKDQEKAEKAEASKKRSAQIVEELRAKRARVMEIALKETAVIEQEIENLKRS